MPCCNLTIQYTKYLFLACAAQLSFSFWSAKRKTFGMTGLNQDMLHLDELDKKKPTNTC